MKIAIDDKCSEVFKQLKFEKKHRYVVFKIEKEQVVVESVGEREHNWSHLLNTLQPLQHRFVVFDIDFKTNDGINASKIFFFNWIPDSSKIKVKMLYATAKQNFKTYLDLNTKQLNASSVDDYNEELVIKQFSK